MRTLALLVTLAAASSTARAQDNFMPAVDPGTLPPACRELNWVPKDARTMTPTLEAYTSLADCIVRERTRAIRLVPSQQTIDELTAAVRQSVDLLDTVIEQGDPAHRIIALHQKADL
jgi:hypothetical protein